MHHTKPEPPYSTQLVIAALNEEQGIGATLNDFQNKLHYSKVIVVDGHSTDRTIEIAKNLGAEIAFQNGFGKGNAIAKALESLDWEAEYVVITDADYTYPAEYIPKMIEILEQHPEAGMVCGNRFNGNKDPKALRGSFYFGNKILSLAHNLLNGITLQDPWTGLRVIRTKILRKWTIKSQGFDIEAELNSRVEKLGYRTVEVPIKYRQRLGEKKLKAKHGATILKRIIQEAIL